MAAAAPAALATCGTVEGGSALFGAAAEHSALGECTGDGANQGLSCFSAKAAASGAASSRGVSSPSGSAGHGRAARGVGSIAAVRNGDSSTPATAPDARGAALLGASGRAGLCLTTTAERMSAADEESAAPAEIISWPAWGAKGWPCAATPGTSSAPRLWRVSAAPFLLNLPRAPKAPLTLPHRPEFGEISLSSIASALPAGHRGYQDHTQQTRPSVPDGEHHEHASRELGRPTDCLVRRAADVYGVVEAQSLHLCVRSWRRPRSPCGIRIARGKVACKLSLKLPDPGDVHNPLCDRRT